MCRVHALLLRLQLMVTVMEVLAYHIKNGIYGQTLLDDLNVLVLSYFKGNIWDGQTKATISIFFDEKANEERARSSAYDL